MEKLSLICSSHLAQVNLFLWQKGIDYYMIPSNDKVMELINKFINKSKIPLYYEDIWYKGALSGEVLLYLVPIELGNYRFTYYSADNFEADFNIDGSIEKVLIKSGEKYHEITREYFNTWNDKDDYESKKPDISIVNTYEIIPCVIIENKPCFSSRGLSEFHYLEEDIMEYTMLSKSIAENIYNLGYPILTTSLSSQEVIDEGKSALSVAEAHGYYGSDYYSKKNRKKLKTVISNLDASDVVKFISSPVITQDLLNWFNDLEATIKASLGGIPQRLPPNDALFNERDVQYRYAPVITTARRRAESYITFGLIELFKIMLTMYKKDDTLNDTSAVKDYNILWRYKGNVFAPTSQDRLNKSIVARNLIRLGVNLHEAMSHIFPNLSRMEIEAMLKDGFAYEYLNGMSLVASKYPVEKFPDVYEQTQKLILEEIKRSESK